MHEIFLHKQNNRNRKKGRGADLLAKDLLDEGLREDLRDEHGVRGADLLAKDLLDKDLQDKDEGWRELAASLRNELAPGAGLATACERRG